MEVEEDGMEESAVFMVVRRWVFVLDSLSLLFNIKWLLVLYSAYSVI